MAVEIKFKEEYDYESV